MADLKTWVPEGFTDGPNPMIAPALARRLQRADTGPIGVVARVKPGADPEAARAFLKERPEWGARLRLPGLFEVHVPPGEIDAITTRTELFAWLDLASRLVGKSDDADGTLTFRVAVRGGDVAAVQGHVKAAGGTVAGASGTEVIARASGAKAADLLFADAVEALELVTA